MGLEGVEWVRKLYGVHGVGKMVVFSLWCLGLKGLASVRDVLFV